MQRNLGKWSAQPPGSAKPSPANETVPEQNPMRARIIGRATTSPQPTVPK